MRAQRPDSETRINVPWSKRLTRRQIDRPSRWVFVLVGVAVILIAVGATPAGTKFWNSLGRVAPFKTWSMPVAGGTVQIRSYGTPAVTMAADGKGPVSVTSPPGLRSGIVIGVPPRAVATRRVRVQFNLESSESVAIKVVAFGKARKRDTQGELEFLFDGPGDQVRLSMHAKDSPAEFSVSDIRLLPCEEPLSAECRADVDLVAQIKQKADFPVDGTDLALAQYLLHWGANAADIGRGHMLRSRLDPMVSDLSAADLYYQYFEQDRLGGACGSLSVFLSKLYRAFGLDAFTFNFGVKDDRHEVTHVSVLVRDRADDRIYIMDPTFNLYFRDRATGRPLDVAQLLEAPPGVVELLTRSLDERDILWDKQDYRASELKDCQPAAANPSGETMVCKNPGYSIDSYLTTYADDFTAIGITPDHGAFLALMRKGLFSVGKRGTPEARDAFLSLMDRAGVPRVSEH